MPPDLTTVAATLDAATDRLGAVDPRLALAALALHVGNHLLRSVAWRNVLAAAYPDRRVGLLRVAAAYASGVAVNAIAPARGGDAVKVGLMRGAIAGSSVATIAATMSLLVAFDLVAATVVGIATLVLGAGPLAPHAPAVGATVAAHPLVATAAAAAVLAALGAAARMLRGRLATLRRRVRQGGAILRRPAVYARGVALPQVAAWACRVGVVMCLLAAFGLPASVPVACVVMVLSGASTIVPLTPGGAGTQQVLLALALSQAASATAVVSFSVAMQAGVTTVNALLGVIAAMALCGTLRPVAAVRAGFRLARTGAA